MKEFQIREIGAEATWPLRHLVLRPGRPLETCRFDGDDLQTTHHFGLFKSATLLAIASIYQRGCDHVPGPDVWQLRGMAVQPAEQKQGHGGRLLAHILDICRDRLAGRDMWCNARIQVVSYYAAHGFRTAGEEFVIEGIGPHVVMVRAL